MNKRDAKTPAYLMGFRRALFRGAGFSAEDLDRPLIGVVNSWGEISPATRHMQVLTKAAKEGVKSAGGTPVEFVLSGLCDGTCGGAPGANIYNMAWRDIAVAYIETVAEANQFDGLVFLPVCDEVVPAHLMAAARLNLPSILVCGGTMLPAWDEGRDLWAGDVTAAFAELKSGKITGEEYQRVEDICCTGAGACGVMGTGNTMQAFAEAIGMTLPGNGTRAGVDPDLERIAFQSGAQVMKLLEKNIKPQDIMTRAAFENALRVTLAVGGSTCAIFHAIALAHEAGVALDLSHFEKMSQSTPFICNVKPSGAHPVNCLDDAGGIPAVMKELSPVLNLDVQTVTGKTLRENLKGGNVLDRDVIRPLNQPLHGQGGIAILRGSLAPQSAIVKHIAVLPEMMVHKGPARVFDSEELAGEAILDGKITSGDVIVVRYAGPKGGPGMPCLYGSLWLLKSKGLEASVALITDGRLSGTIRGAAIGYVSPEAAEGGPIALLRDGDLIRIDIPQRKLDLLLAEEELKVRRSQWIPPRPKKEKGSMALYTKFVTSAHEGAYLKISTKSQTPNNK
ncbi:MAG: dihydroxy-acid dehydratase [Deltaproteobacteria bacterium]|nr:dihydroxy-acid dehydratase [Deltaproteobacteria bacterium]